MGGFTMGSWCTGIIRIAWMKLVWKCCAILCSEWEKGYIMVIEKDLPVAVRVRFPEIHMAKLPTVYDPCIPFEE